MRTISVCIFFILALGSELSAQVNTTEEPLITAMRQRRVEVNRATTAMTGWRVQLIASTDRSKVMDLKSRFLRKYPNLSAQWDYSAPYYKLKVGAFLTKLEAAELRNRILKNYPDAYITKDYKIKPREFQ